MTKETKENAKKETKENLASALISEKNIIARGKSFQGIVQKKFPKRVVILFERLVYVRKYERYARARTKIHARLPNSMEKEINVGDLIMIQECRPLSKMVHFIVIKKIKSKEELK